MFLNTAVRATELRILFWRFRGFHLSKLAFMSMRGKNKHCNNQTYEQLKHPYKLLNIIILTS